MRCQAILAIIALFFSAFTSRADSVQHGLRVPDGFEVTEFADNSLANDNGLAVFSRPRTNLAAEYS